MNDATAGRRALTNAGRHRRKAGYVHRGKEADGEKHPGGWQSR